MNAQYQYVVFDVQKNKKVLLQNRKGQYALSVRLMLHL